MRSEEEAIREGFQRLAKNRCSTFIAVVENNYPDKDVIDAKDMSGTLYTDIRKRASVGLPSEGILITPSVGSSVLVSRIGESDELFIEMFSGVESILFNNGENGGLTITPELKLQLDKMTARIDTLYNAIQNSAVVAGDGGAAFKANMNIILATAKEKEKFSKIENLKIKH